VVEKDNEDEEEEEEGVGENGQQVGNGREETKGTSWM